MNKIINKCNNNDLKMLQEIKLYKKQHQIALKNRKSDREIEYLRICYMEDLFNCVNRYLGDFDYGL